MISYSATLDVSRDLDVHVSLLLGDHRRRVRTRRGTRALTCWSHAVLVLRWFRDGTRIAALAADNGIGLATAYRYVHEAIDVLADQAPDLREVIDQAARDGLDCLLLDGTLVSCDRVTDPDRASDRWYSGKPGSTVISFRVEWTDNVEPETAPLLLGCLSLRQGLFQGTAVVGNRLLEYNRRHANLDPWNAAAVLQQLIPKTCAREVTSELIGVQNDGLHGSRS